MRGFEYLTKTLDNQVIDQILASSNTQKNLIYNVVSHITVLRTFPGTWPAGYKYPGASHLLPLG